MLAGESRELFLHTVCDTGEHASEDHVSVQITTDVEVALEDGITCDISSARDH